VWLEATDGLLLVGAATALPDGSMPLDSHGRALVPDEPVAVSRIAMLSPTEGWLEGIRVDPRVRGLGVATDMQTAELHWLAVHEPGVIRYAIGAQNEGSHRLGARHGIELLARFRTWAWHDPEEPADDSRDEATGFDEATRTAATGRRRALIERLGQAGRTAATADGPGWWRRVSGDPSFKAGGHLYELRAWAMQELTEAAFHAHMARGEVFGIETAGEWALAILPAEAMATEDVSIHLALLAGQPNAALRLAGEIQRLARESIRFRLPMTDAPIAAHLEAGYAAAGFRARPFELHILGRHMTPSLGLPPVNPGRLVLVDEPRRLIEPPLAVPTDDDAHHLST
jgi:hypothetical protein